MFDKISKFIQIFKGDYFMKKMLQFALILSALLFTFSCSGDGVAESTDPGTVLTKTWMVTGMSAYDDVACSETESVNGSIVNMNGLSAFR